MSARMLSWLLFAALALVPTVAEAKLQVAATLPDLGALAREVGGDHVDVGVLASARQDPHYVDPRPSLILVLARADALIVNGLELEASWLAPLLVSARNPNVQLGAPGYFDASTAVTLLQVPAQKIDRTMGDLHPGGNPHFTFDPRRGAAIARALAAHFARLDPARAAAYQENGARLAASLEALAARVTARFASLDPARRQIVSYHQSLIYLVDWLGLREVALVEPRPGIPPDPGQVAKVLATMRSTRTRVLVQEEFYPTSVTGTLRDLAKAELVVLPGATRFDEGQRYEAHVTEVSDALYAALSK